MDKLSVITDPLKRDDEVKKLFLYVMGLRDILVSEQFFKKIKDIEMEKIADVDNVGFLYTFIITYGRIFHKNKDAGKIDQASIIKNLDSKEKDMHENLIKMRDQFYAHNDPQYNNLLIHYDKDNKKITATASIGYHYLSKNTQIILSLLKKVKTNLETSRDESLSKLYSEHDGYKVDSTQSFSLSYYTGFQENPISRMGTE